jgi:hypothetical protein
MKYLARRYFKFILVCVGLIFAFSIVDWDGTGIFFKSSLVEAADPSIGFTIDNPGIRKAIEVQKKHEERLMGIPGVVGVGTGIGVNGQAKIRVFTVRANIPDIPKKLEEIPVEMKVTGMFVAYSDPRDRFLRPVPIGISTGHPDITAGTLGARVIDGYGNVYALSNNHVYANSNDASIGDNVIQPGTFDGGVDPNDSLVDVIGQLCDYEPIDFSVFGMNTIDAAIACTTMGEVGNATPTDSEAYFEGYVTPNSIIFGDSNSDGVFDNVNDLLGLPVKKFGRTTKLTHGQVSEINATVNVCYDNCEDILYAYLARFVGQIVIIPGTFSGGGDSGSVIVTDDENNNPVGLLFAGSPTHTLANRIDFVLNRFNVNIDGSQPTVPENELCDNGVDDDGDTAIDCEDSDCIGDTACTDFEICDDDEDNDYDGDIDCYDTDCEDECAALWCFKGRLDGSCNPKKDGEFCPDCLGSTQPDSENCYNGVDDDGDALVDCDDSDCDAEPACGGDCLPKGQICNQDVDCCTEKCRGGKCR